MVNLLPKETEGKLFLSDSSLLPLRGYREQLIYVYSFLIHKSLKDERYENQGNYALIVFFPRWINSYMQPAYKVIDKIITCNLARIEGIAQLTEALLAEIKGQIKFSIYYWHLLSLGIF